MNAKFVALNSMPLSRDIILLVITEKHNGKTGLAVAFGSTAEECLYDAFDCPMCGCQVIAKERKRDYISFVKEDEDNEQI